MLVDKDKAINAVPLIKWAGGKRKLAKALLPLFPEHQTYIELFCGGAALFFYAPSSMQV